MMTEVEEKGKEWRDMAMERGEGEEMGWGVAGVEWTVDEVKVGSGGLRVECGGGGRGEWRAQSGVWLRWRWGVAGLDWSAVEVEVRVWVEGVM